MKGGIYAYVESKNIRWWLLLILLLSVAFIRRKLLKTTYNKEHSILTNSELKQYSTRIVKKSFNSIIQIWQSLIIDYFSTHWYIVDIILYLFYILCTKNDDFLSARCLWLMKPKNIERRDTWRPTSHRLNCIIYIAMKLCMLK